MDHFEYRDGRLFAEEVSLDAIAEEFGTPCYVYSRATLERHWHAFDQALDPHPHLVCYSVKANGNLAVLNVLARLGSGFDIVSVGELKRVRAAGGRPEQIIFSGVGKSEAEMRAALGEGIGGFNIESAQELEILDRVAGSLGVRAPVSLRVNPDVDAKTHPYIATGLKETKFGVPITEGVSWYQRAAELEHIDVQGIDCHIGSQLTTVTPYLDALNRVLGLVDELQDRGINLSILDLGGGLGIRYRDEVPPQPAQFAELVLEAIRGRELSLHLEPGRAIAGNAGMLLARVAYVKHNEAKSFVVVDAAMNDLVRPALYGSWHEILAVDTRSATDEARLYDVVGPVCESGDFLGKSLKAIGRAFGKPSSSIYFQLAPHGGIRPAPRCRSRLALTLWEREEISRGIVARHSIRSMASLLGRSPSTVSREVRRNGGYDRYRAALADDRAWA